ncbi:hypothetical protein [Streptomyces sp. NPDC088794]|uniref:hypothetical protein n=1 Tax=Streptomyces sp. NPDC088794 TaxID=3365902 RepID=UPI003827BCE5
MPARSDKYPDQTTPCCEITDHELDELQREITRDVTTVLMFATSPYPEREAHLAAKLQRADVCLKALSCGLLSRSEASSHVARIVEDLSDVEGALYFGCLLSLAQEDEGAMWWWQFAAGAGDATAAYCLYLEHLRRGELRDAEHWMGQALKADARIDIDFSPPASEFHPPRPHLAAAREAVDRVKVEEIEGTRYHLPDRHLADRIKALDTSPSAR